MNSDIVWSVILMLIFGMSGVAYIVYYIIKIANDELNE